MQKLIGLTLTALVASLITECGNREAPLPSQSVFRASYTEGRDCGGIPSPGTRIPRDKQIPAHNAIMLDKPIECTKHLEYRLELANSLENSDTRFALIREGCMVTGFDRYAQWYGADGADACSLIGFITTGKVPPRDKEDPSYNPLRDELIDLLQKEGQL